jgi:hypothetical protein
MSRSASSNPNHQPRSTPSLPSDKTTHPCNIFRILDARRQVLPESGPLLAHPPMILLVSSQQRFQRLAAKSRDTRGMAPCPQSPPHAARREFACNSRFGS